MATAHTPSQMRSRGYPLDTPTPASSSHGHHSTLITSLKPSRSRSNLSHELKNAFPTTQSRTIFGQLNNHNHNHNHGQPPPMIIEEEDQEMMIQVDQTERERRRLEMDIRLGMGELNHNNNDTATGHNDIHNNGLPSGASSSGDSLGYGDLSDDFDQLEPKYNHHERQQHQQQQHQTSTLPRPSSNGHGLRARIEDESSSMTSSGDDSEPSIGDDFSLRIGLTGTRAPAPTGSAIRAAASALDTSHPNFRAFERSPISVASAKENQRPLNAPPPLPPASKSFPSINKSKFPTSPTSAATTTAAARIQEQPTPRRFNDSSYRVPDVTGLTDGLSSPVKTRNQYVQPAASNHLPPRRTALAQGRSSEAAAVSSALEELRTRLAYAEADNEQLERRLLSQQRPVQQQQAQRAFVPVSTAAPLAPPPSKNRSSPIELGKGVSLRDFEEMLRVEREKREATDSSLFLRLSKLETLVRFHSTQIDQLQTQSRQSPSTLNKIVELKNDLKPLLIEIEVLKSAVEELLSDRQQQQQEQVRTTPPPPTRPTTTNEEERASVYLEDPDRTPRAKSRTMNRSSVDQMPIKPIARPASQGSIQAPQPQPSTQRAAPNQSQPQGISRPTTTANNHEKISCASSSSSSINSTSEGEDQQPDFERAEAIFRSVASSTTGGPKMTSHRSKTKKNICDLCKKKIEARKEKEKVEKKEKVDHREEVRSTLRRMEDAFLVQKKIYIELSDTYRSMDSRTSETRRRTLANHLKESIDVLETMADDIRWFDACFHQFTTNQNERRETEGVI